MTTIVTFLLDRTGSMGSIKDATIEAFNAYVDELRKADETSFSLLQFDSVSIDTTCKNASGADIPHLTHETFVPRASTPLIDACVKTIKAVEKKVSETPDAKVVICFQTDGDENCSREHTWAELNDLIKEKSGLGWQFNFMGAGIDAYKQASRMGLSASNTVSYDSADLHATKAVFGSRGSATMAFASGARTDMSYSAAEKRAAGDRFAPDLGSALPRTAARQGPKHAVAKKAIVDDVQI